MPLDISVTGFDFDLLAEFLNRLARPSIFELRGVEQGVRAGFAANFNAQGVVGGSQWAALAPRTQVERSRLGFGPTYPILIRTGRYQRSWTRVGGFTELTYQANGGGWTFGVGSNDARGFPLEFGARGRNLPARPVRLLDFRGEQAIAASLQAWVDNLISLYF